MTETIGFWWIFILLLVIFLPLLLIFFIPLSTSK